MNQFRQKAITRAIVGERSRLLVLSVVLASCLSGCSREGRFVEQQFRMHTLVEIQVRAPKDDEQNARAAMAAAFDAIARVEHELSWFENDNDLARIRTAAPGTIIPVSQWTWDAIAYARTITRETDGLYDVCAGPVIRLWGFGPDTNTHVPTDNDLQAALQRTGSDKLVMLDGQRAVSTVVAGVEMDLSSLAAGVAVDRAAEALLAAGYSNFLVNGGGEIRVSSTGAKTWQIGIQIPAEDATTGEFLTNRVVKLKNGSVSTSGSYRNFFKAGTNSYAHIVNPKTGRPVMSDIVSITTLASNCTVADAWSTALFTMPAEQAVALADQRGDVACLVVQAPVQGSKAFRFTASKTFDWSR